MSPSVNVCIPTYNRRSRLEQSSASVLAQDHDNLELLILDNASTDDTEPFGRDLARRDARVRYVRQPRNIGMVPNFIDALARARGEYFMWLSDDDHVDPAYVRRCVEWLLDHPDYSVACGHAKYYRGDEWVVDDIVLDLPHRSPHRRVLTWYYHMDWCGAFFGVMPRKLALKAQLRNALACDKLLVGAMAYMGKIKTLTDVILHRRLGGMSRTGVEQAAVQGLPRFCGYDRDLAMGVDAVRDILRGDLYADRGPFRRALFAAAAFATAYVPRLEVASDLYAARAALRAWTDRRKEGVTA
jgi:glycosyltransferase involved in cell wall biosynthesis